MKMSENNGKSTVVVASIVGALAGAATALLLAPKSGNELREDLNKGVSQMKDKAIDWKDQASEKTGELKEKAREKTADWKDEASEKAKDLKGQVTEQAKKTADKVDGKIQEVRDKAEEKEDQNT